ncbi:T9SS outer membrane translocon Sov/SprA [Tenacibaculum finnmarkense]|uniref:Cell surface protein SprA n=1 Tax=Tenacibaculum finnmarkense genomovar ulcerans TaxID=2781388 RepID=A0A2I2LD58_9FLAO|nr:cell surface protein SprA [Tenacibaculum finnmarkense]SOS58155.1 Cell surface protein SprA [Tenacibaculum finnmarkense genomovar ulcerans]
MKKKVINIFLTTLALLVSVVSFSQNTGSTTNNIVKKDTLIPLKYRFSNTQKGALFLNNPTEKIVRYDKAINKFVMVEKIGDYTIGTPIFMTPNEYKKYRLKNDIKAYFQEKVAATNPKSKGSKKARKNLLPKYYVNSKFFESIFGGNTVDVKPTGQVNIKLGGVYQKNENPQISIENQSNFTFDFDQQLSVGLQAKIGERLKVTANYDTQSTFDFQNIIKLEYTPTQDDIIRNIEAGNVSMPIKNSLINGAQTLFGVKTELQFGKTHITAAFSQQNSQSKTVVAEGGATIEPFELRASDYDNDRHFFLGHYFRENYKEALVNYPLVNSPINITRVEVWVTNTSQNVTDYRSIVGLADLGESNTKSLVNTEVKKLNASPVTANGFNIPDNKVNKLANLLTESGEIRDVATIDAAIKSEGIIAKQGYNYSYLQNARKLQPNEFRVHNQLGFISLNRRLNDGEVLAVAYEYTVVGASNGETVFKVGEFSNDGVVAPSNLVVKLLRSEILNTIRPNTSAPGFLGEAFPTWQLMMKNVYALGAFPLQREGFRIELLYRDDQTGTLQNTLQNAETDKNDADKAVRKKTLLRIFNLDKLDQSEYAVPKGDGFFDYVDGITVNSERGYVIFPEPEPFGNGLKDALTNASDQKKYLFEELYLTTKIQAKNEYQNKDKFFLKGYFKAATSRGISLGGFNIPRGSVRVTAGGRQLVEGIDYVVDYQLGRVQILDAGLEASGIPINATTESNNLFSQQRKTFIGIDVEHRFSENFTLGGTYLNVSEKPITPKVNFGGEPINNTMLGFNLAYSSEVPFLTKLANKLPFVETDAASNVSVRADLAYLIPGSPSGINVDGTATSYLDDFEASQIPINLSSPQQWFLASTPESQQLNGGSGDLSYNYNRAKIAWYNVDQLFYAGSNRPGNIDENELSRNEVRQIRYNELFPNTDLDITQQNLVRTLDLAYYPSERGPYNYNVGQETATKRWAGIMRPLTTNNFEQSNVEYIQFWLMDPYENYSITQAEGLPAGVNPQDFSNQVGKLFINLGNVSEDILKDGRKQYENGLPEDGDKTDGLNVNETAWGNIPINPSILYAFDNDNNHRKNQDIGLDGLNDAEETAFLKRKHNLTDQQIASFGNDPAGDNFQYFRGGAIEALNPSILSRYKNFNGTQGNSPTASQSGESYPTSSTAYPDTEDINKDQTMNPVNSYFEYEVSLNKADLIKGQNHIIDVKEGVSVSLSNGQKITPKWYQFRIPIRNITEDQKINGISDFNSIRFIRMFLTEFKMPVVLRFGELELVRGDWRRYTKTFPENGVPVALKPSELNKFEVGVVSIEQNQERYQLPPGIQREELQGTNRIQRQNEQSVTLKVTDLPADQVRTIYKNISIDMRRYKKLRMFLHAETPTGSGTQSGDMVAVIRLGTDLNDNYYEIEKPLSLSTSNATSEDVWLPAENNLEIPLKELANLKLLRPLDASITEIFSSSKVAGLKISVKGNPTLAQIKTVMLGVKNTSNSTKTAEVWFNELRAVGFDNKGGWATVVNADANLADVMDVSLAGRMSTIGFGSIEDRVQQRSIEQTKQYSVATNVQLGKMMPKKWNIQLPMSYSYGEEFRDPKYDPQFQDIELKEALDKNPNSKNAQDYTRRKSISFINVKKNKNPESKKTPKFYDVENVSVSYAHNEELHRDYNIEKFENTNVMAGASYNFNFKPFVIEPFKKSTVFKSKYLKLIKDLNINPVPKTIAVNSKINRSYNTQQSRNLIEGLTAQPELIQRRFLFNWDYTVGFDLTKSLQLNFNATNNYIYDSFGTEENLEIYDQFFTVGRPDNYHQKLNATYKLPLKKIPFLNFVTADYGYTADFDWKAGSQSVINQKDELTGEITTIDYQDVVGNMIQNANTHNLNATIDFGRFYKTLKLDKLLLKGTKKSPVKKASLKKNASFGRKILKGTYNILTSVKRGKISYSQNNGTLLQGYKPSVGFLGRNNYAGGTAPSLGFVFGSQTAILNTAIENGWLVTRTSQTDKKQPYYSKNYGKTAYKKLDYTVSVKPFKNLTIDLRANKIHTSNLNQQLDVISDGAGGFEQDPKIKAFETGNYSTSHFMMGTIFTNNDALYDTFLANRATISERLSAASKLPNTPDAGYKITGQQVMLPAFVAAYSGINASKVSTNVFKNIPIPNWTLRFNGLMQYKWFKKSFSSFTVSHGYKSSYTIGNYTNNLQYDTSVATNTNNSGNYQSELLLSSATLIDEFSPLVKVDFRMKNSFSFKGEIRRDRSLTLNFNNNTLTDVKGTEYVVGFGYKIKDVKFVTKFTGKKQTVKGDINLRADVSLRDNLTLIRSVDKENSQITGGEKLLGLKFIADYNLSSSLTASFYYNHQTFKYAVSTTFPRQSINAGINIIYNLGN